MPRVNETEQIQDLLQRVRRDLPPAPAVVDVQFELGADHVDDPAVFIVVVLEEKTKDQDWTPQNLDPVADRFRDAIFDAGVDRYPYVRFARPSELNGAA